MDINFPPGTDPALADLLTRSPFWSFFIALRPENDCHLLPPAFAAFLADWKATRSPFIRRGMVAGLLLGDELATKVLPAKAKTRAMLLLDRTVADRDARLSRPLTSLAIPTKPDDGPQP